MASVAVALGEGRPVEFAGVVVASTGGPVRPVRDFVRLVVLADEVTEAFRRAATRPASDKSL